jgi:hypothetical protein
MWSGIRASYYPADAEQQQIPAPEYHLVQNEGP